MVVALLQALISGLAVGGAYALVALGFSITFTTTKTLNFSHGEFVSAGRETDEAGRFRIAALPGKPHTLWIDIGHQREVREGVIPGKAQIEVVIE